LVLFVETVTGKAQKTTATYACSINKTVYWSHWYRYIYLYRSNRYF